MNNGYQPLRMVAGIVIGTLASVLAVGCSMEGSPEQPTAAGAGRADRGQPPVSGARPRGTGSRVSGGGSSAPRAERPALPAAAVRSGDNQPGGNREKAVSIAPGARLRPAAESSSSKPANGGGAAGSARSGPVGKATSSSTSTAAHGPPLAGSDAGSGTRHTAHSLKKKPVDPVKANGRIFVDWPQPELAIVISGEQIGYLEPCGCAGLENQKGGLKRRHSLVKRLEKSGWPLLMVDLGGQIRRFGPQAEIKFRRAIESLVAIGYQAIGFGPQELRLPVEQLVYVASNMPDEKNPFVSANVGLLGFDSQFTSPLRVVEVGGLRVGVTAVLGAAYLRDLNRGADLETRPPEEALAKVVPQLRKQADFLILLSHAPVEESTALARKFPDFDLVVTAGGAAEPPGRMIPIEGSKAKLIEIGHKGMYVAVVGLYNDPGDPLRYQRVPIDARFPDSPEMQAMMADYQKELTTLGLRGLGLKPTPHPSGRKFVGSQRCVECHTEAAAVWEQTPHAHATATLVKLNPPRHHDPECLSCHVTGWEPQEFFPFVSGYLDRKQTPQLQNVGCENCHGPGSAHAAAEEGDEEATKEQIEQGRAQMRILLRDGEAAGKVVDGKVIQGPVTLRCYTCHDLDNSPDFDFVKYWPHVEHQGMD